VEALAARRADKEIASEYFSDSNTVPDYNSESESELNMTEEPLSGPATTWKTQIGNGHRLLLVTGKTLVTDQALQIIHHR
jgi:hypothetical protein